MDIKERLKKTFQELIAIDGIYPHEDEVISYVEKRFRKKKIVYARDSFGNIIVKIPGDGEGVLLSTHLDIPEPAPNVRYRVKGSRIQSDGSGILGADPKTGLAILIELLCELSGADCRLRIPVDVVLTRGEETGLLGARHLDYSLVSAKIGLVLDEDGPVTQIVTQAPAFVRIDAVFQGKTVHPREPEKGVNALRAATAALQALPWGYSTKGVTWNVGLFQSGTARNSVPGTATAKGELRGYDSNLVKKESERVEKTFKHVAKKYGAKCHIDREFEFGGYALEKNHLLFIRLKETFSAMGLRPNYFKTFGGSDANIFNDHGIVSVPIGSGYHNAHQYSEYADINEMATIYTFLKKFLKV